MKAIRWLGLFGDIRSLPESLKWELSQREREVCAEILLKDGFPRVPFPTNMPIGLGLRVHPQAVRKVFNGDVYSHVGDDGRLRKNRSPIGWYKEGWVFPEYIGIVLYSFDGGNPFKKISHEWTETLQWFSRNYKLPIYHLKDGKFILVYGNERGKTKK